jgi:DNA-binding transcriptional MocR family regulator
MPNWTEPRLELVSRLGDWSAGAGPLYARLAGAVRTLIENGEVAAGARLPPERPLAEALGVSRTTVVLAYRELRERGLAASRQGSGTWVPRRPELARGPVPDERSRSFLVDSVTRAASEEAAGTIGLMGACLPGSCVPLKEEWQAAEADLAELASGTGYSPQGSPALRHAIASGFEARGLPTSPDEILVTNGAQQAIDLVGRLLVTRGDAVVLEDPTYLGAIDAFTLAGARLSSVPVGGEGAELTALRAAAQSSPVLVYLVPSFHNPTGTVMPEPARRAVAELVEARGLALVEDESLAELGFGDEPPPPPIAAFAKRASVFTIGSMSKLYWGGLRVGWVRGPRALIARLTRLKVAADLSGSLLGQALAARLLSRRDEVVRARRRESRARFLCLARLLRERLPDWSWQEPLGGLTLWVWLPSPSSEELARVALRHGVAIVPGPVHSPSRRFPDRLRLPYVLDEATLAEGIARLARAWQACRQAPVERQLGVIV